MDTKTISSALKGIEDAEYNLGKFNIFKYDTLDEADPGKERVRADVTVEIGGPSAHIKITVLTRAEHTKVKNMMTEILTTRLATHQANLLQACKELTD